MWILISNLDQPAFKGHEAEKDLAELLLWSKMRQFVVSLSFCRSFAVVDGRRAKAVL
jgi:hypothetical protein